jgi:hypothetical protein
LVNVTLGVPTTVELIDIVAIVGSLLVTVTDTGVGGTTGKLTDVAASTFTPVKTLLAESLLLTFT